MDDTPTLRMHRMPVRVNPAGPLASLGPLSPANHGYPADRPDKRSWGASEFAADPNVGAPVDRGTLKHLGADPRTGVDTRTAPYLSAHRAPDSDRRNIRWNEESGVGPTINTPGVPPL